MVNGGNRRILVIEDDMHIAEGLRLNLQLHGYDVTIAGDGPAGLQVWKCERPHLIVLDIMLPTIDGLTVLQAIRLSDERIPVLILSAKAATDDIIKGLSFGVDDYLTKPFNIEEFLLRVDRLIKRAAWSDGLDSGTVSDKSDIVSFGKNVIDLQTGTAICRIGRITLTDQEARLLKLFIANPGSPLHRNRLLEIGWGYTGNVSSRTVDNFMVRLRKYFENDPKNPRYFTSVRSIGYVFDPDPPADGDTTKG